AWGGGSPGCVLAALRRIAQGVGRRAVHGIEGRTTLWSLAAGVAGRVLSTTRPRVDDGVRRRARGGASAAGGPGEAGQGVVWRLTPRGPRPPAADCSPECRAEAESATARPGEGLVLGPAAHHGLPSSAGVTRDGTREGVRPRAG